MNNGNLQSPARTSRFGSVTLRRARIPLTVALFVACTWTLYLAAVSSLGKDTALTIALGLTAFGLGLRHGFDADHIAVIDHSARKLLSEGRAASHVGLWFALGHSTVVFVAVAAVGGGLASAHALVDENTPLRAFTSIWGPTVSSLFILVFVALAIRRLIRRGAGASVVGGPVFALLKKFKLDVDRGWKMYVVGLLFGLGFDTASSILLLTFVAAPGTATLFPVTLLVPLLFCSGMAIIDGLSGATLSAFQRVAGGAPYGLTLSLVSIVLATAVAVAGLQGALSNLGVPSPVLEVSWIGPTLVALFAACLGLARLFDRRALTTKD